MTKRTPANRWQWNLALVLLGAVVSSAETKATGVSPPVNDRFADRTHIGPGNVHTNGTLLGAKQENGEPFILTDRGSVWWQWACTNSGPVTVQIEADSDKDYNPSLMSLSVATGVLIVQLDRLVVQSNPVEYDDRTFLSATFHAIAGLSYVIEILADQRSDTYRLCVVQGVPPVVVLDSPQSGSRIIAGGSIDLSAHLFDTDAAVDHVAFCYSEGGSFSSMAVVKDWPFVWSWQNLVPGAYQILARGQDASGLSAFSFPVNFHVVPVNDHFSDRIYLQGMSDEAAGFANQASREEGEPLHGGSQDGSIWWSWTAPRDGHVTISDSWRLFVYSGDALGALTFITNSTYANSPSQAVFLAEAGTTYSLAVLGEGFVSLKLRMSLPPEVSVVQPARGGIYIQGDPVPVSVRASDPEGGAILLELVGWPLQTSFAGSEFDATLLNLPLGNYNLEAKATDSDGVSSWTPSHPFQVVERPVPPPSNDHYTNRITLTGAPLVVNGTTVQATTEPGEGHYHSVWWRWLAPASGPATITFGASVKSASIFAGDASSAAECVGRPSLNANDLRTTFQATAGTAYQIRIYQLSDFHPVGEVAFQIVQSPAPMVELLGPSIGSAVQSGDNHQFEVRMTNLPWPVKHVAIYVGGQLMATRAIEPFAFPISFYSEFETSREVYAVVTDQSGWIYRSASLHYQVHPVSPDHDSFMNRTTLDGNPLSVSGSTFKATRELDEPEHGLRSVWHTWSAPSNGFYTITIKGTQTQTVAVYTGQNLSGLISISLSEPPQALLPGGKHHVVEAQAGMDYQIAVIDAGDYSLSITPGRPPSIRFIRPDHGMDLIEGSLTEVGILADDPDEDQVRVDVYLNYSLLAGMASSYSAFFRARGTLSLDSTTGQWVNRYRLDAIAVDDQGLESHAAAVNGNIIAPPLIPASNDNFEDRISLPGLIGSCRFEQNAMATIEHGEPIGPHDNGQGSTWWSWRAPANGKLLIQADAPFDVLTGSKASLRELALVVHSQSGEGYEWARFEATDNVEYQVRVITDYLAYDLQHVFHSSEPAFLTVQELRHPAIVLNFQSLAVLDWAFEFSEDLTNWIPFHTNRTRWQHFQVIDSEAAHRSQRYYRSKSLP